MADDSQQASPVELANGIGSANETPEQLYQKQFDPAGYAQQQQEQLQQKQGGEVSSLLNAANPTPMATAATPPLMPSVANTLSGLGTNEANQVGNASLVLEGQKLPEGQFPALSPTAPAQVQPAAAAAPVDPYQQQMDMLQKSYGAQEAANNSVAKATVLEAKAKETAFKVAEAGIAKAETDRAEIKYKYDSDMAGKLSANEQEVADYKEAAGEKIIPGRLLANMDTNQRLQSGIFMALSAYGSAMSGQENQALKVINNAINQDIDAQRFNIENKLKGARMGVENSQYMISQSRQRFGDDETAVNATKMNMLSLVQQQLNTSAARLDQATAIPKAQALNAQIEMQKQTLLMQIKQQQAQAFMMKQFGDASSGGNVDATRNLSPQMLDMMKGTKGEMADRAHSYIPGYGTSSGGVDDKKKMQEELQFKEPVLKGMDRVRVLQEDFNKATDFGKKGEIKTEITAIKAKLKQGALLHTNRFQPEIIAFLDDFLGDQTAITSYGPIQKRKFDTAYNSILSDIDSAADTYGYPVPHRDTSSASYNALKKARSK